MGLSPRDATCIPRGSSAFFLPRKKLAVFDHEKPNVYRLQLQIIRWVTPPALMPSWPKASVPQRVSRMGGVRARSQWPSLSSPSLHFSVPHFSVTCHESAWRFTSLGQHSFDHSLSEVVPRGKSADFVVRKDPAHLGEFRRHAFGVGLVGRSTNLAVSRVILCGSINDLQS